MKSFVSSDQLVICLEGRLDSEHSAAAGIFIRQAVAEHPGLPICLDADGLEYISSSGLRILLALRQQVTVPIVLKNASPEVYHTLDLTGFTSLIDVRQKLREVSLEGCRLIGRGAFRTVYRLDGDTVVKVFRGGEETLPLIAAEREQARDAFLRGVPTAIPFDTVKTEKGYGAIFELVDAQSLGDLAAADPACVPELAKRYASFLHGIHALTLSPGELPDARERFLDFLTRISPVLDEQTQEKTRALLRAMPEDLHLLHGDAHWKNVMDSKGTLMVIDMDTLCTGDPVFEFAGLYMTYVAFEEDDPGNTLQFHDIDAETARSIFFSAMKNYLGDPGEGVLRAAEDRIRIPGLLIYIYNLIVLELDKENKRIPRAAKRMKAAVLRADGLALREAD